MVVNIKPVLYRDNYLCNTGYWLETFSAIVITGIKTIKQISNIINTVTHKLTITAHYGIHNMMSMSAGFPMAKHITFFWRDSSCSLGVFPA